MYIELHTHDLETLMFGSENFIEENSFSTSHQLVNVYSEPERRYEIRSEDVAVDVQIYEDKVPPYETTATTFKSAVKPENAAIDVEVNYILPLKGDSPETSMRARFMDMVRMMQMTYSYKPVLLKALLFKVDEDGKAKLSDLVAYFRKYYENRKKQGLEVEQGGVFTRSNYTEQDVANLIINMPFRRFAMKGMMYYDPDSQLIFFNKALWTNLTEDDETEIERICDEKLDSYYTAKF